MYGGESKQRVGEASMKLKRIVLAELREPLHQVGCLALKSPKARVLLFGR